MTIALCGAGSSLGSEIAASVKADHRLVVLDPTPPDFRVDEHRPVASWEIDDLVPLLHDVDGLIQAQCHDPRAAREGLDPAHALLEVGARLTYNLVHAAHRARVDRFVFVSTLESYADYDPDYIITGQYFPRPTTDPFQIACWLGECVCREAAREWGFPAVVARVGRLVRQEEVAGQPFDRLWVDPRDAGAAVAQLAQMTINPRQARGWLRGVPVACAREDSIAPHAGRWFEFGPRYTFPDCPPAGEEVR